MAAKTHLRASAAFCGRPYGSFSGRSSRGELGQITQCLAFGAHSGRTYGRFSGRVLEEGTPPGAPGSGGYLVFPAGPLGDRIRLGLLEEEDLLLLLLVSALSTRLN